MTATHGQTSSHNRLQSLRDRHAQLEEKIQEEQKHPAMRGDLIRRLKAEKLRLKEEIEDHRERA